jgi:hypothetical protein
LSKAARKERRIISAFLLGLFLFLQALAASPALHEFFHPDAGKEDHECAVTLFLHGQVSASGTVVAVVSVPTLPIFHLSAPAVVYVSTDVQLLPSRGPPISAALV